MHSASLMQRDQLDKLTQTAAVNIGAAEEGQLSLFFCCKFGALLFNQPEV